LTGFRKTLKISNFIKFRPAEDELLRADRRDVVHSSSPQFCGPL